MMSGEYIEVNEDMAKFVTLDGHRISIRNVQMKEKYGKAKVIVPGKTLTEISKIINGDNDKEVMIYFGSNQIMFEFDQTIVISRLIEGEYFKIEHMLSKDYETKITVNKKSFKQY
jgi:DNA polymerase-3 subunit beta